MGRRTTGSVRDTVRSAVRSVASVFDGREEAEEVPGHGGGQPGCPEEVRKGWRMGTVEDHINSVGLV